MDVISQKEGTKYRENMVLLIFCVTPVKSLTKNYLVNIF